MLVLTRKIGERIAIGDDIEIVVSEILGNRVKIAVEAPIDTKVVRTEAIRKDSTK